MEVSAQSLAAMLSTSQQTFSIFRENLAEIGGFSKTHELIFAKIGSSGFSESTAGIVEHQPGFRNISAGF